MVGYSYEGPHLSRFGQLTVADMEKCKVVIDGGDGGTHATVESATGQDNRERTWVRHAGIFRHCVRVEAVGDAVKR